MPRARSQAWRAVISTAVPASKAPCWVLRFSAGGRRAAGPRTRRATAPVLPASRTGIELNGVGWVEFFTRPNIARAGRALGLAQALDPTYALNAGSAATAR